MKKLLMLVLVLATTIGYAQDKKISVKDGSKAEQMIDKRTNKMAEELNLTEAQQAKVKEIHQKNIEKRKAKRSEIRANSKEQRSSYKAQMKEVLTTEQYEQWIENIEKSKKKKRSKSKKGRQ